MVYKFLCEKYLIKFENSVANKSFPSFQVWFQNRRTKWRKKHAAEMATAKRKQEELGDGDGDCSEPMDSDSESLDLVDTGSNQRKRCRMEDDMRH